MALPPLLVELVATGRWARDGSDVHLQQGEVALVPSGPAGWVEPGERIILLPPPFVTVAEDSNRSFWESYAAPSEIVFSLAIEIADLGLGSDAPIILDYQRDITAPRVRRLRYHTQRRWEDLAPTFEDFAEALGLRDIDWETARARYRASLGARSSQLR